MKDKEKLRSFEEKGRRASKLFRDIRSGKFTRDGYRNPRIRVMSLNRCMAKYHSEKSESASVLSADHQFSAKPDK